MAGSFWETACQPNLCLFRPHSLPWMAYTRSLYSPLIVNSGTISTYLEFYSLQDWPAYSVDAQDQLDFPDLTSMIHAKPAEYNSLVLNQSFP